MTSVPRGAPASTSHWAIVLLQIYGIVLCTYALPFVRLGAGSTDSLPLPALLLPVLLIGGIAMLSAGRSIPHISKLLFPILIVLTVSLLIASGLAGIPDSSRLLKQIINFATPLIIVLLLRRDEQIGRVWLAYVAAAVVLCVYGYYGFFTGRIGTEGTSFWWIHGIARYWGIHYTTSTRNSDTYFIAAAFWMLRARLGSGFKSWRLKLGAELCLAGLLGALLLSFSRSAWLSLAVTALVDVFVGSRLRRSRLRRDKQRVRRHLLSTILIALAVISVLRAMNLDTYAIGKVVSIFSPAAASSFMQEKVSNSDRVKIILTTFEIFLRRPLGVGAGGAGPWYHEYGLGALEPENDYLLGLLEAGIGGFLAVVALWVIPFLRLWHRLMDNNLPWSARGALLLTTYFCVQNMFNPSSYSMLIWFILGMVWASAGLTDAIVTGRGDGDVA